VVIAISGGPDSVALTLAVLQAPAAANCRIVLAHLNHGLRGFESDADEAFVRHFYDELKARQGGQIALRCGRIDVAGEAARRRDNLESTARRLRYAWLADAARAEGIPLVLSGHTANDQAETVLQRLLRGSGLRGLRGIARERELRGGIRLVRPLLDVTRDEVLEYLASVNQDYCQDRTNSDPRLLRTRVRHRLLPQLAREYNPAIVSVLCRLAEQAASQYAFCQAEAKCLLATAEQPRAGAILVFDRHCLAAAPRNVVREALRLAWTREGWPERSMTFQHWDRLALCVLGDSSAVMFPGGIQSRVQGSVAQLGPGENV
jgi:tRNA(Ile)-lysidine synthase